MYTSELKIYIRKQSKHFEKVFGD